MAKKTVENLQPMSEAREAINDNFTELYAQLGGGSSSGAGGSPTTNAKLKEYIDSFSQLGFDPPDAIIVKDTSNRMTVRYLNIVNDASGNNVVWNFLYRTFYGGNGNDYFVAFENDTNGPVGDYDRTHNDFNTKNLKWYIDNGYAIYTGGGTSSSGGSSIVTGNYTGDGETSQTIELGFRPAVVHIKCTTGPWYGEMTQIDGLEGKSLRSMHPDTTTPANHHDDDLRIEITDTGFIANGNTNNSVFNYNGSEYYYYAISTSGGTSSSGGAISADTAVMVGTTNGTSGSSAGLNDRNLVTFQGVNGVTGLTLDNDIVTLTEPGRYYIKATTGAYASGVTSTAINFITGDYAGTSFEGSTVYAGDHTHGDAMTTESSTVVDITQTTTLKVQTRCNNAKSGNGLFNGGAATLLVQRISSSGGYSSSNETWGVFDGTESGVANGQAFTIQGGNNIQSITRVATGIYEVNMINPKPNEYYHVSVGTNPLGYGGADGGATDDGPSSNSGVAYEPTASKFRLDIRDNANNQTDSNRISFHVVC